MSSSSTRRPANAFPLYNDLLQSIAVFFSEHQLHLAAQLSKQWNQVLKSMPTMGITSYLPLQSLARIPPPSTASSTSSSIVARHIGNCTYFSKSLPATESRERQLTLQHLGVVLPNLTTIEVTNSSVRLPDDESYSLPPLLKTFRMTVNDLWYCDPLFNALSSLQHLRSLTLNIVLPLYGTSESGYYCHGYSLLRINFHPLIALANQLQILRLVFIGEAWKLKDEEQAMSSIPSSLVEFVRQSQVSEFEMRVPSCPGSAISQFMARFLELVTSTPCPLLQSGKLHSINLGNAALDRPILTSLIRIPSLRTFSPFVYVDLYGNDDTQLFSRLPHIISLYLAKVDYANSRTTNVECTAICSSFPKLEVLQLQAWDITSKQLDHILAQTPRLTSLALDACTWIDSLAPLSTHGLSQRLKDLNLTNLCIPVSDLSEHVLPLQSLEKLFLARVCEESVPESVEAQLRAIPSVIECNLDLQTPRRRRQD